MPGIGVGILGRINHMGRLRLRKCCRSSLPIDIGSIFAGMAFRFGGADRGTTMNSGITARNIDPGDESRLESAAHRCGIAMEVWVRRLFHEKREKAAASLPRSAAVVSGRGRAQICCRRNGTAIERPHSSSHRGATAQPPWRCVCSSRATDRKKFNRLSKSVGCGTEVFDSLNMVFRFRTCSGGECIALI